MIFSLDIVSPFALFLGSQSGMYCELGHNTNHISSLTRPRVSTSASPRRTGGLSHRRRRLEQMSGIVGASLVGAQTREGTRPASTLEKIVDYAS